MTISSASVLLSECRGILNRSNASVTSPFPESPAPSSESACCEQRCDILGHRSFHYKGRLKRTSFSWPIPSLNAYPVCNGPGPASPASQAAAQERNDKAYFVLPHINILTWMKKTSWGITDRGFATQRASSFQNQNASDSGKDEPFSGLMTGRNKLHRRAWLDKVQQPGLLLNLRRFMFRKLEWLNHDHFPYRVRYAIWYDLG